MISSLGSYEICYNTFSVGDAIPIISINYKFTSIYL